MSEYDDRDSIEQGNHYMRHLMAMTTEKLHSKSAIAGELAHRDIIIEALKDSNASMANENAEHAQRIGELIQSNDALEKRAIHVTANNANLAGRNAILRERYDLPVDRLPAHRRLEELQRENSALKAMINHP